jgi:tetratricopeptide (TPR) repeat protein
MRKYGFFLPLILIVSSVAAQTRTKGPLTTAESPKAVIQNFDLQLYNKAIGFGDYEVARIALFNMIIRHPDSLNYLDSLVTLYFSLGQMPQCIMAGNQYLERDTNNLSVMEMVALSYSQLSKNKEALAIYERMFQKTGNIYYAYQTAVQQFYLKRIGECNQMIDIIINDPKSATEKIAINVDQTTQQQVPLKAAALNMRGIIFKELSMTDKARSAFEEALRIMPDFTLAKGNIELMDKAAEGSKDESGKDAGQEKKK